GGTAGGRNTGGGAGARRDVALRGGAWPASVTVAKPIAMAATQRSTSLCIIVPSYEKRSDESAFYRHSLLRLRPVTIVNLQQCCRRGPVIVTRGGRVRWLLVRTLNCGLLLRAPR